MSYLHGDAKVDQLSCHGDALFLQLTVTDTKIHLIVWDCASFDVTLSHK